MRAVAQIMVAIAVLAVSAVPPATAGRERGVWDYSEGIFLETDGRVDDGPCFRVSGRVTAPEFFEKFKRIDDKNGTLFRRGKEEVKEFPAHLLLAFVIHDLPCSFNYDDAIPREYLTREMMSSIKLSFFWKRGTELRPAEGVNSKYAAVEPVMPYAASLAHSLPPKFEWQFVYEVPSENVPLTDSLVLLFRNAGGRTVARVAARL